MPFDAIPMTDLRADSLATKPSFGGNNFDHALTFMEPYLKRSTSYVPVLLFMTDGGDCGDGDSLGGDYRQRSYDHMAQIKRDIPDLRVYVTIVFSTSSSDIEGAKRLCMAAGMDVETHYNAIEDEGGSLNEGLVRYGSCDDELMNQEEEDICVPTSEAGGGVLSTLGRVWDELWSPSSSSSSSYHKEEERCAAPALVSAPSSSSSSSHYSGVSEKSAQRKMASHWDSVYTANSLQSECLEKAKSKS